jgi:hypothetical protein
MSTQAQLNQADLALQRADQELLDARSALNKAQRILARAQEAGSSVDPGLLRQAQDGVTQATARVNQANNAYTAAQQNYTTVFNQPDTDAAQNPQVNNNPPAPPPPPPPPLTSTAPAQGNPPDPTVTVPSASAVPTGANITVSAQPVDQPRRDSDAVPLATISRPGEFIFDANGELLPADSVVAQQIAFQQREDDAEYNRVVNVAPSPLGGRFTAVYDPETGKFNVENLDNGETVQTGLTDAQATRLAGELSEGDPAYFSQADDEDTTINTDLEELNTSSAEASQAQALLSQARQQAEVSEIRKANGKAVGDGDWRVRLRLAPYATYLYKSPEGAGIMEPLRNTDGVVFPYTPRIDMSYVADYNPTDLVHSNYRGYFYKGSRVGEVTLTADFTAQDSAEADYLLATIHFFRSCTKMFYGQDDERGAPPPLVFLTGLGEFQFNEHPCVIQQFNYNLPNDVDYIRARGRQSTSAGVTQGGNGLLYRRQQTGGPTNSYSLSNIWSRLTGANVPLGAINYPPAPPNLGLNSPTYVPTKMQVILTLLPMPTRSQVTQQFSLDRYANGNLLKGGFW